MGILDNVIRSAVPGGSLAKPLALGLIALLASRMLSGGKATAEAPAQPTAQPPAGGGGNGLEGLDALVRRFQQGGQGKTIHSWIGQGENQTIAPRDLGQVLGPDALKTLAQQTGLSQQELLTQFSQLLPAIIDKLTPQGRLPSRNDLN